MLVIFTLLIHSARIVSAVKFREIYVPHRVLDESSSQINLSQMIVGKFNTYRDSGGVIEVLADDGWQYCMETPSGTWNIEDVDSTHVNIVSFGSSDRGGYYRTRIVINQYIRDSWGCYQGFLSHYSLTECSCDLSTWNVHNFDVNFPQNGLEYKNVGLSSNSDSNEIFVYSDLKSTSTNQEMRLFTRISINAGDYTCSGQMENSINKIVAFGGESHSFRTFDLSTKLFNVFSIDPDFSAVGMTGASDYGANLMPPTQTSSSCSLSGISVNKIVPNIDVSNPFESFISTTSSIIYLRSISVNTCNYTQTNLSNIVFFQGQQAISYDNQSQQLSLLYTSKLYNSTQLDFKVYTIYEMVSEYKISSTNDQITLLLHVGNTIKIVKLRSILPSEFGTIYIDKYKIDYSSQIYQELSTKPNVDALIPEYDGFSGLNITVIKNGNGKLAYHVVNTNVNFVEDVFFGTVLPVTADPQYQVIQSISQNDIQTVISIYKYESNVKFTFNEEQFWAITQFNDRSFYASFPICSDGTCIVDEDYTLTCDLPYDYAITEFKGTLEITIGDADVVKSIPITLNAGVKFKVFSANVTADCDENGSGCRITIFGANFGDLSVFDFSDFDQIYNYTNPFIDPSYNYTDPYYDPFANYTANIASNIACIKPRLLVVYSKDATHEINDENHQTDLKLWRNDTIVFKVPKRFTIGNVTVMIDSIAINVPITPLITTSGMLHD